MALLHDDLPRLDYFIGIRGPQRDQTGNRPQRRQLLDWLMGWPVFTDADRIMRVDPDRRNFHDGRQPDRRLAVFL